MNYSVEQLKDRAKITCLNIVKMVGSGVSEHYRGSCSIADVVVVLKPQKAKNRSEEVTGI